MYVFKLKKTEISKSNFLHVLGVGFYKGVPEINLFSITHATWWSLVNAVLLGTASVVLLVYFVELVMYESIKKRFFWDFP